MACMVRPKKREYEECHARPRVRYITVVHDDDDDDDDYYPSDSEEEYSEAKRARKVRPKKKKRTRAESRANDTVAVKPQAKEKGDADDHALESQEAVFQEGEDFEATRACKVRPKKKERTRVESGQVESRANDTVAVKPQAKEKGDVDDHTLESQEAVFEEGEDFKSTRACKVRPKKKERTRVESSVNDTVAVKPPEKKKGDADDHMLECPEAVLQERYEEGDLVNLVVKEISDPLCVVPYPLYHRPSGSTRKDRSALVVLRKCSDTISVWLVGSDGAVMVDEIDGSRHGIVRPLALCFVQNQADSKSVLERTSLFVVGSNGSVWLLTPFLPRNVPISSKDADLLEQCDSSLLFKRFRNYALIKNCLNDAETIGPLCRLDIIPRKRANIAALCSPLSVVTLVDGSTLSYFLSLDSVESDSISFRKMVECNVQRITGNAMEFRIIGCCEADPNAILVACNKRVCALRLPHESITGAGREQIHFETIYSCSPQSRIRRITHQHSSLVITLDDGTEVIKIVSQKEKEEGSVRDESTDDGSRVRKRALSSYNFFCKNNCNLATENVRKRDTPSWQKVNSELGVLWRALPEEEKKKYEEMAEEDKKKYKKMAEEDKKYKKMTEEDKKEGKVRKEGKRVMSFA